MKRAITALAVLATLTAVVLGSAQAASAAGPTGLVASIAGADCARVKAKVGKRAFRKRFGEKRPMARCIAQTAPAARRAIAVATAACQAELDEYPEDFYVDWESFGECVSTYAGWEMDGGLVDDPGEDEGTEEE